MIQFKRCTLLQQPQSCITLLLSSILFSLCCSFWAMIIQVCEICFWNMNWSHIATHVIHLVVGVTLLYFLYALLQRDIHSVASSSCSWCSCVKLPANCVNGHLCSRCSIVCGCWLQWLQVGVFLFPHLRRVYVGVTYSKKPKALLFRIGMKFGTIVLQVNTHRLMEWDFWYDIILSRSPPWRNFMQKSAAIWWVHMQHLPDVRCIHQLPASISVYSSWSIVHSY